MNNIFDVGSWLAFIGSLIVLYFNKRGNAAIADDTETETSGKLQKQVNELVTRNGELWTTMETMRMTYEKKMDNLEDALEKERQQSALIIGRMNKDIVNLGEDLRIERARSLELLRNQSAEMRVVKEDVNRITGKLPLPSDNAPLAGKN